MFFFSFLNAHSQLADHAVEIEMQLNSERIGILWCIDRETILNDGDGVLIIDNHLEMKRMKMRKKRTFQQRKKLLIKSQTKARL